MIYLVVAGACVPGPVVTTDPTVNDVTVPSFPDPTDFEITGTNLTAGGRTVTGILIIETGYSLDNYLSINFVTNTAISVHFRINDRTPLAAGVYGLRVSFSDGWVFNRTLSVLA